MPDTQAALRGITYSNPSPDSRVTYSEGDEGDDGDGASRVIIILMRVLRVAGSLTYKCNNKVILLASALCFENGLG